METPDVRTVPLAFLQVNGDVVLHCVADDPDDPGCVWHWDMSDDNEVSGMRVHHALNHVHERHPEWQRGSGRTPDPIPAGYPTEQKGDQR